jgi:hypothetical protein
VTLDELLKLARVIRETPWARLPATEATRLARAVLDILSAPPLCGWPMPEVVAIKGGWRDVAWEPLGADVEPDEAIALGVALIRAGLEAKGDGR